MRRAFWAALLSGMVLLAGGCKAKTDSTDAIHTAVVKYLSAMTGLNVNNMTVTVTKTVVTGDTAQAEVEIRAKNGDANAPGMQRTYQLQKQGEDWVVVKSEQTGGMQHPTAGEMPQGNLPPGHPPTGGANGQVPANHPDFNSILNNAQQSQSQSQQQGSQPPAQQPSSGSKP
ncbi:MAG TPA: hypothetical protein VMU53_04865 [Candidatus Sulfotelmatobacter sp.]|nr:hypothetical protein [Candidatus Sulfotelmatobacter sp.]